MTLKTLAEELSKFVESYPELGDKEVCHASECGYSVAGFKEPFQIAIPIFTERFLNENINEKVHVQIVSNDDGYRTNWAISGWKFLGNK